LVSHNDVVAQHFRDHRSIWQPGNFFRGPRLEFPAVFDDRRTSTRRATFRNARRASMGRLTLNILLSFAQFEREVRLLESGEFATIAELAEYEGIAPSYMTRVLRLSLLAPDIVEAILDG
jgi:hypothetical protein